MWITGQIVDDRGHALSGVTITFTRAGFATLERPIDRISNYVATINACLQTLVAARSSD